MTILVLYLYFLGVYVTWRPLIRSWRAEHGRKWTRREREIALVSATWFVSVPLITLWSLRSFWMLWKLLRRARARRSS